MTEQVEAKKNIYHIAFSFAEPRPGIITIPADTPEEADKLLREMAKDMVNLKIHEIVDAKDMPDLQKAIANAAMVEEAVLDEQEEEKKVVN